MSGIRNLSLQIEHTGKRIPVGEIDQSMTANELLEAMAGKINLPTGTRGTLSRKLTSKQLLPNQSLKEAGVEDGETLLVNFERTAGCFLPGTQIELADHRQISIESVKVGDELLSFDLEKKVFTKGAVTECFTNITSEFLVINGLIKVTPSHLFFADGQWVKTGDLRIGSQLFGIDQSRIYIDTLELRQESSPIFNLHLSDNHTFFAEGILVHNLQSKLDGNHLVAPRPPRRVTFAEENDDPPHPNIKPKRVVEITQGKRGWIIKFRKK